jgi:hypothetical protein
MSVIQSANRSVQLVTAIGLIHVPKPWPPML